VSFTYSGSSVSTDLAKVRLAIGDTVDYTTDDESLTDEEIQVSLDATTSVAQAAILALEHLIGKLRRKVDRSVASVNSSQGQKLTAALDLLKILRRRGALGQELVACAGGLSIDRADDAAADDDYPEAAFSVGGDDMP
jgi:hypothetical protein